jgi:caspase domain-containing protein
MRRDALLLGTTQYADPFFSQLTAPAPDVQELHEVLTSPQIGQFSASPPLLNEPAHRLKIELEAFFADRAPEDLLLLYFSGHGIVDEDGQLYLGASNTERKRLRSTAVEASFVRALMDSCRSETQLLILDCCHSGAFGRAKAAVGSSVGTARAFGGNGRIVLTASDATQFAFEGNTLLGGATTSLFTHFLVQGLRTGDADLDGDGLISVDELYTYAHQQVSRRTNAQTPSKWVYRQQGDVVFAHNVSPRARPDLLSPELLSGIDSRERSIQKGALEGLAEHLNGPHPGRALAARQTLESLLTHDSRFISAAAARLLEPASPALAPSSPSLPLRVAEANQSLQTSEPVKQEPKSAADEAGPSQPEPVVRSRRRPWDNDLTTVLTGAFFVVAIIAMAVFMAQHDDDIASGNALNRGPSVTQATPSESPAPAASVEKPATNPASGDARRDNEVEPTAKMDATVVAKPPPVATSRKPAAKVTPVTKKPPVNKPPVNKPLAPPSDTAPVATTPAATATTTPQSTPMDPRWVPSAIAFPCTKDTQCGNHRCYLQAKRCAWPCGSDAHCQPGFQCVSPTCVSRGQ